MSRREFLLLPKVYDASTHKVGGWYCSDKYDGCRCFWDGGLTRGKAIHKVPWAGIMEPKTGETKQRLKMECSGLWSRYGNPILAPDWFLNTLPSCPLDGQLFSTDIQIVRSCVAAYVMDDSKWDHVQFGVFGSPNILSFLQDGTIRNQHHYAVIEGGHEWLAKQGSIEYFTLSGKPAFATELANLDSWIDPTLGTAFLIHQKKLSTDDKIAEEQLSEMKGTKLIRSSASVWTPQRVDDFLTRKG